MGGWRKVEDGGSGVLGRWKLVHKGLETRRLVLSRRKRRLTWLDHSEWKGLEWIWKPSRPLR